jgi:hypothetical protein
VSRSTKCAQAADASSTDLTGLANSGGGSISSRTAQPPSCDSSLRTVGDFAIPWTYTLLPEVEYINIKRCAIHTLSYKRTIILRRRFCPLKTLTDLQTEYKAADTLRTQKRTITYKYMTQDKQNRSNICGTDEIKFTITERNLKGNSQSRQIFVISFMYYLSQISNGDATTKYTPTVQVLSQITVIYKRKAFKILLPH